MGFCDITAQVGLQLDNITAELSIAANIPKPKIYVIDDTALNAFATGRDPQHASIAVTKGLMAKLDREEMSGVIAHELSHVAHKDVTVMTIASFSAILAGFMVRSAMWGSMMRDRRDQNTALVFFAVMIVSVLVYLISYLLINALSRYRELGADRGAALITGKPSALATALQKVTGDMASPLAEVGGASGAGACCAFLTASSAPIIARRNTQPSG